MKRNSEKKKKITICVDPTEFEIFRNRREKSLQSVSSFINKFIIYSNQSSIADAKILSA